MPLPEQLSYEELAAGNAELLAVVAEQAALIETLRAEIAATPSPKASPKPSDEPKPPAARNPPHPARSRHFAAYTTLQRTGGRVMPAAVTLQDHQRKRSVVKRPGG